MPLLNQTTIGSSVTNSTVMVDQIVHKLDQKLQQNDDEEGTASNVEHHSRKPHKLKFKKIKKSKSSKSIASLSNSYNSHHNHTQYHLNSSSNHQNEAVLSNSDKN